MVSFEKEITNRNVEYARKHPDLVKYSETESKYLVTDLSAFEALRADAIPINDVYISAPFDEFSLRVREIGGETPTYTTELKDRGTVIDGSSLENELPPAALKRLEIPAQIATQAFRYYADQTDKFPQLHQRRACIDDVTTLDFIEDFGVIEIETDDPKKRADAARALEGLAENRTGDPALNKEAIAYRLAGKEHLQTPESLDALSETIVKDLVALYATGKSHVVAGLTGMSGSGKTTVARMVKEKITHLFGNNFAPVIISTDDYHYGKEALERQYGAPYASWDASRTYNTVKLASDLLAVKQGMPLIGQHFDFSKQEVVVDQPLRPSPFIIIEGLYAGSRDLEAVRDLHYELPTGPATSVGRDARRLAIEGRANEVFPTPAERIAYQVSTALPLYFEQERPPRNSFSSCARVMAERAFMLDLLEL